LSDNIIKLIKELGVLTPQGMAADTLSKYKWPLTLGGLTVGGLIAYGLWKSGILGQMGESFSEFADTVQEYSADTVENLNNVGTKIASYLSNEIDRNESIKDAFSTSVVSWIKTANSSNTDSAIKNVAKTTNQHISSVQKQSTKVKKAIDKLNVWGKAHKKSRKKKKKGIFG
jgi:hypothetical protein